MLNKQEKQQASDYSETEKQHRIRQEYYIPLNNQEREIPPRNRISQCWKKTGFADKTLWDIVQLLGAATFLGLVGLWINWSFQNNQVQIAAERYQQTALDNYFDQMTDILIDKKLASFYHSRTENPNIPTNSQLIIKTDKKKTVEILDEVEYSPFKELEAIARAQTLTALNLLRLDTKRRDFLINFLRETNLVAKDRFCVDNGDKNIKYCKSQEKQANLLIGINLNSLDLPGIKLDNFILTRADFGNANLSKAFLSGAEISNSNLSDSNLSQAYMKNTKLYKANLKKANLTNADLEKANLTNANLENANLTNANLNKAYLTNANLTNANLTNANLTNVDLTNVVIPQSQLQYAYLCNTTIPSNTTIPRVYLINDHCRQPWIKWSCIDSWCNIDIVNQENL